MNKYAETPGEGKAPYPGGSQKKSLTLWGGLYIKKSPGNKVETQPGEPMKKRSYAAELLIYTVPSFFITRIYSPHQRFKLPL